MTKFTNKLRGKSLLNLHLKNDNFAGRQIYLMLYLDDCTKETKKWYSIIIKNTCLPLRDMRGWGQFTLVQINVHV